MGKTYKIKVKQAPKGEGFVATITPTLSGRFGPVDIWFSAYTPSVAKMYEKAGDLAKAEHVDDMLNKLRGPIYVEADGRFTAWPSLENLVHAELSRIGVGGKAGIGSTFELRTPSGRRVHWTVQRGYKLEPAPPSAAEEARRRGFTSLKAFRDKVTSLIATHAQRWGE